MSTRQPTTLITDLCNQHYHADHLDLVKLYRPKYPENDRPSPGWYLHLRAVGGRGTEGDEVERRRRENRGAEGRGVWWSKHSGKARLEQLLQLATELTPSAV